MSLMSFVHPFMRTGEWWDLATPSRVFDQNFGMGVLNDPFLAELFPHYQTRPRLVGPDENSALTEDQRKRGVSEVVNDDRKFSVKLDVSHFKPEEIKVKVIDNQLIIEANHEEKMDPHGFISRSFKRRYVLPKNVDMQAVTSNLTQQGVLAIEAPKIDAKPNSERAIPIQMGNKQAAVEEKKK